MINKIVSITERSKSDNNEKSIKRGRGKERWVQFGAIASSKLDFSDAVDSEMLYPDELLQQYLALPVDKYALLDPKWVRRELNSSQNGVKLPSNVFRLTIPLQDVIGVDLTPSISIAAHPDPDNGTVTFVGSDASIGSESLDEAFKVNLVAVLCRPAARKRNRWRRTLPRISAPDHLPGRPIYRLRRWAARARGRDWPLKENTTEGQKSTSSSVLEFQEEYEEVDVYGSNVYQDSADNDSVKNRAIDDKEGGILVVTSLDSIDVDDPSSSAPFPSEQVYMSQDKDSDSDVKDMSDPLILDDMKEIQWRNKVQGTQLYSEEEQTHSLSSDSFDFPDGVDSNFAATNDIDPAENTQLSVVSSEAALLDCRVSVTVAVRIPGPLLVVPNPLLGYAGSLLLRTALSATLPNFLTLLKADFERWTKDDEARDPTSSRGDLFQTLKQNI